jgi:predicted ATPase
MLKTVRLRNFKSFQEAQISLGLRNVLVGANMSGKSNFLEVFRFLRRVTYPEPGTWGVSNAFPGGFQEFTWKGGKSNLIEIALEGTSSESSSLEASDWKYELAVHGDERGSIRVQDEKLELITKGVSHPLIARIGGARTAVNADGKGISSTIDDSRAAIESDLGNWDGAFLRNMISSWRFYRLTPHLMRTLNPAAAPPFLNEFGDNLSAWLMHLQTRYSAAFARIQQAAADVLPGFVDLFTSPTRQATVSMGSKERYLNRPVSLWEMSDGELTFVAMLSLIFSPPELGGTLYCIEEPENHLHPRLIETLVELLKQTQTKTQAIVTTHSPNLIDRLSLDELLVFEKHSGATNVTYPRDKTHLRDLLHNEESGLGDLYYSGALSG